MNEHQAIILYGSSPGTGKSTLSSFLFEQLSLYQVPVLWVYEDDVLHIAHFAKFVADIQSGDPNMMRSLLRATRSFVQECLDSNLVAITDSIFPCVNWLMATNLYACTQIASFSVELEQLLAPLNPFVIFLDGDPKIALQRAIEQRGEPWFEGIVAALNSYTINRERPLHTLDEVSIYFEAQATLSLELLQQWSCDLLLIDAVQTPLAQVKATVLAHLGLDEIQTRLSLTADDLARFVGVYHAESNVPITNPLLVTLDGEALQVNIYWPNGCPLVAEGGIRFRLENTSHRICFELQADGAVVSLTYDAGGNRYRFVKAQ